MSASVLGKAAAALCARAPAAQATAAAFVNTALGCRTRNHLAFGARACVGSRVHRPPFRSSLPRSCFSASAMKRSRALASTAATAVTATVPDATTLCTEDELERRDAAIAGSKAVYESWRSKEMNFGPPFGRKLWVGNLRTADGDAVVPKLTIVDGDGHTRMTLTEEDFEAIVKLLPKIKDEFIKYHKKLN
mmetsp:Transcript_9161/g.23964  ORF Transcript_9161/g.23964 Transcript_9161/m.23964 type:complete len:191 (-) Transcript_9161:191-763(-)